MKKKSLNPTDKILNWENVIESLIRQGMELSQRKDAGMHRMRIDMCAILAIALTAGLKDDANGMVKQMGRTASE